MFRLNLADFALFAPFPGEMIAIFFSGVFFTLFYRRLHTKLYAVACRA